jgi:flagellar basal-body rod protein FlgG
VSGALQIGAIGMREQQRALAVIANNVANVNTPAFKREDVRFSEIVVDRSRGAGPVRGSPGDNQQSAGVQLNSLAMVMESGELRQTGQPLDLAVDGSGFIELMGPGGTTLLWRGGRLRIMDDGVLASEHGFALRSTITIPADASTITIDRSGMVAAFVNDQSEPIELGQIELVRINGEQDVQRLSGGVFRLIDGAELISGAADEDGMGSFAQSSLEQSTVGFEDEMIQLLLVQRAFAANAQVVQAADQLLGLANNLRR